MSMKFGIYCSCLDYFEINCHCNNYDRPLVYTPSPPPPPHFQNSTYTITLQLLQLYAVSLDFFQESHSGSWQHTDLVFPHCYYFFVTLQHRLFNMKNHNSFSWRRVLYKLSLHSVCFIHIFWFVYANISFLNMEEILLELMFLHILLN